MVRSRHNKQGLLPQTPYDLSIGGLHVCSRHHTQCPSTLVRSLLNNALDLFNHHLDCIGALCLLIQHTPNCQWCSPLPLPWPLPFSFHNKLATSLTFWDWDVCVWICNERKFIHCTCRRMEPWKMVWFYMELIGWIGSIWYSTDVILDQLNS